MKLRDALIFRLLAGIAAGIAIGIAAAHYDMTALLRAIKTAEELFGDANPIGKTMQVAGSPYTVIGVMVPKLMMGNYGGMDADHAVIPITTVRGESGSNTSRQRTAFPSPRA